MSSLSTFTLKDLTRPGLIAALVAIFAGGTMVNDLIFSAMGTPGDFPPIALLFACAIGFVALLFFLWLGVVHRTATIIIAVILLAIAIYTGDAWRDIIGAAPQGF